MTVNYRKIWENQNGKIPKDIDGRSYEIHHIDGNKKNNDISNLLCVDIHEHYNIHFKQEDYYACKSIANRLKISPSELRGKLKGHVVTIETREKIRLSQLGKKLSEEHKQQISKSMMGHKTKETTKEKIRKSLNKHSVSIETRVKMSNKRKGKSPINKKTILQLDKEDNLIREWDNIALAEKTLSIYNISSVAKGKREFAGGFKWKYKHI